MKTSILVLLMLLSLLTKGQAFAQSLVDKSITITPEGLRGGMVLAETANNSTKLGAGALSLNTTGIQNTAIGFNTLSANTTGNENTAIGNISLEFNTTGYSNTALGSQALWYNSTGSFNTAIGSVSLGRNSSGIYNTATGESSLEFNTTGSYNTASGANSLHNNQMGDRNTAIGYGSLFSGSTGNNNTAVGYDAGNFSAGSNNTYLGYATSSLGGNLTNATAIGYRANVNSPNKVRIGNSDVTAIEGQVAWSNPSDRRLKENIVYTSRLGLDFISRLQTVSYSYIADQNKTRYDGFIAQDIEQVMKELGVPFSGLKKSDDGTYSLAYSDFVMPLVNAVKEQQQQIQRQQKQSDEMKKQSDELIERLSVLEQLTLKNTFIESAKK